jgi:hypothetical protein
VRLKCSGTFSDHKLLLIWLHFLFHIDDAKERKVSLFSILISDGMGQVVQIMQVPRRR